MKQVKGIVFDIQKYSLHDGPGIRTTVFLKGCPLACKWCSNPESQFDKIQILWDEKKCLHCGHCKEKCSRKAISIEDGNVVINPNTCKSCMSCCAECPGHALSAEGEYKTVEDVMKVVLQDKAFYEESGGGVTLSGGEILSQPEFAKALLLACKAEGLHTVIETTSYADTDVYLDVVSNADLLLCDIKHWNSKKHKEGTGVNNELILKNIKAAADAGMNILLRLPVIPGFNDSSEDAEGFVKCMNKLGLNRIQLLPFHKFGENKYALLGKKFEYEDVSALYPEDLEEYKQVFVNAKKDVFI